MRTAFLAARQRARRRREAYLAEAQKLSTLEASSWTLSTGEINWSDENLSNLPIRRAMIPTVISFYDGFHPEDVAMVRQTNRPASQDVMDFDHQIAW